MANRRDINIKDWLEFKPYSKAGPVDVHYLRICKNVIKVLDNDNDVPMDRQSLIDLSCYVTSYVEDIVSETNIWSTFLRINEVKFNKKLPFFDMSDYYEGEINPQDISFLVWHYFDINRLGAFVNPYNKGLQMLQAKLFPILERCWEEAPVNHKLKSFYRLDKIETDIDSAKDLMDLVFFQPYLLKFDTSATLVTQSVQIFEENVDTPEALDEVKDHVEDSLFEMRTCLGGLRASEWAAYYVGPSHRLHKCFLELGKKVQGRFFYKGENAENLIVEHVGSGRSFDLTKKAFDDFSFFEEGNHVYDLGIVKWHNEWWVVGQIYESIFSLALITKERKDEELNENFAYSLGESSWPERHKWMRKAFLEFNNENEIAYMNAGDLQVFCDSFLDFVEKKAEAGTKMKLLFRERVLQKGFKIDDLFSMPLPHDEECTVCYTPEEGLFIGFEVGAFPEEHNPFYDLERRQEHESILYTEPLIPEYVARYCYDNYKESCEFFKGTNGPLIRENFDFFLTYYKNLKHY